MSPDKRARSEPIPTDQVKTDTEPVEVDEKQDEKKEIKDGKDINEEKKRAELLSQPPHGLEDLIHLIPNHTIEEELNERLSFMPQSQSKPAHELGFLSRSNTTTCSSQSQSQGMDGLQASSKENQANETGTDPCKVRRYTPEEREKKIERYRNKRPMRNFQKKINYTSRKTLADRRPRVKGRFAGKGDNETDMEMESEIAGTSYVALGTVEKMSPHKRGRKRARSEPVPTDQVIIDTEPEPVEVQEKQDGKKEINKNTGDTTMAHLFQAQMPDDHDAYNMVPDNPDGEDLNSGR